MNVLIFLFGIGRGLKISEPSISKNLIYPLSKECDKVEILYVYNQIGHIDNPRSGDKGIIETPDDNLFKTAIRYDFTNSELMDEEAFLFSKQFRDAHQDNYISNRNLITQLGMLRKFDQLSRNLNFDKVIFCRDDLYLPKTITNWAKIFEVTNKYPIVPSRQWHGGVSERFCISSAEHASILANRIDFLHDYFKEYPYLNGEMLFKFVLETNNIKPASRDIRFYRVRLKGLHNERFILPIWRPKELLRVFSSRIRYLLH